MKTIVIFILVLVCIVDNVYSKTIHDVIESDESAILEMKGIKPTNKNIKIKSFTISGKYDPETKNGSESSADLEFGLSMREYFYYSKYFTPELKLTSQLKDNESQTSWNAGVALAYHGPILEIKKRDIFWPFASIGGGYVDANNSKSSGYYQVGAGVDFPIIFNGPLDVSRSVIEIGYKYQHANNKIYDNGNKKENEDEILNLAFKFIWK